MPAYLTDLQMVRELEAEILIGGDLSKWEQSFIENLSDSLTRYPRLSERQHEKLVEIYERVFDV